MPAEIVTIVGTLEDDNITASSGTITYGFAGDDIFWAGPSRYTNVTVKGGPGDDTASSYFAFANGRTIYLTDITNLIVGTSGGFRFEGGPGQDALSLMVKASSYTYHQFQVDIDMGTLLDLDLISVEVLSLSIEVHDTVHPATAAVKGTVLNDVIRLVSHAIDVEIATGGGADDVYLANATGSVALGPGADRFQVADGSGALMVRGGRGRDSLESASADAVLRGGPGNDFLVSEQAERLVGAQGNDKFWLVVGEQRAFGGSGDDEFWANAAGAAVSGVQKITAGPGADTLRLPAVSLPHPVIQTDFATGEDRIVFNDYRLNSEPPLEVVFVSSLDEITPNDAVVHAYVLTGRFYYDGGLILDLQGAEVQMEDISVDAI